EGTAPDVPAARPALDALTSASASDPGSTISSRTDSTRSGLDARTPTAPLGRTTAAEESSAASLTPTVSSRTSSMCSEPETPSSKSTGSTTTDTTNPETSGSQLEASRTPTSGPTSSSTTEDRTTARPSFIDGSAPTTGTPAPCSEKPTPGSPPS